MTFFNEYISLLKKSKRLCLKKIKNKNEFNN